MRRIRKLGTAFPDQVHKTGGRHSSSKNQSFAGFEGWVDHFIPNYAPQVTQPFSVWRLVILVCLCIFLLLGLFIRLFHLQIVEGQSNRELANSNRIQIRVIHAPRGVIYDRNAQVLARNDPGFRIKKEVITRDQALEMEAKNDPKFSELEVDNIRSYPHGESLAHVVGYVGEITEEELSDPRYSKYRLGDRIGRMGIEQMYETTLKGIDGAEIIEIDSKGDKLRTLRTINPTPGQNIYLSLDLSLQQQAYLGLKAGIEKAGVCCGALVGEDPQNGQILTLVSYPSFDPNVFSDQARYKELESYFTNPDSVFLNRVIAGTYPPGSTFKIASALAGLSSGAISSSTIIEDTGIMRLGDFTFANWYFTEYGRKEGPVDILKALQRSNDIYFYTVGQRAGEKVMGDVAQKMGLGKKLGVDLPGEADGLIPGDAWKRKEIGLPWYPGDSLHMAIGQGFVLTTPIQILATTAFVASDGVLIQPHLATKITSPGGETVKTFKFDPIIKDLFKKSDLELVKKGLSLVPKNGGTAWPFFNFPIATAGKTGTAEFGDPQNRTHAWYTSYAPEVNPEIVLTVLVEKAGEGSSVAGPISKQVYAWYFATDKAKPIGDSAPIATEAARTLGE